MPHLLGIDIGTSGTKTLICDETGKVLATAMAEHPISSPRPGWSEQNPEDWWQATIKATRAVLRKAGARSGDIGAIGLSGQMHGSVFLGDGPRALRPALLWNDQRTAEQCRQIEEKAGGREALIELVANPALTGFTAPKILWVRQHEPKVYDRTRHILLPKDYIRYRMTGQYATEVSDASGTLLLDVVNRAWSERLLSLLHIDKALLPAVYESPQITGALSTQAAAELGLKSATPVVGGAGRPSRGRGWKRNRPARHRQRYPWNQRRRLRPQRSADTRSAGTRSHDVPCGSGQMVRLWMHALGGRKLPVAPQPAWRRGSGGGKKEKGGPLRIARRARRQAPPGSEGLFFLPYLTGERCPHPDPLARGGWIGISTRTTRDMLIRSVMEGVTFGMRDALEIMRQMDIPIEQVRASGGGARSEFWRQLQADIYNLPIVLTNASEGPAYGAALLSGVGIGRWNSVEEACKACIRKTERISPAKRSAAAYDRSFAVYAKLYDDLKARFAEMAALV